MQLWEILVPKYLNDGTEIPVERHHLWDDRIRSIAGGLTILKSATGVWESPDGNIFREKMIPVRIACTEVQIREIIDFTISFYDQEAVMAYQVSERVIIKHRSEC